MSETCVKHSFEPSAGVCRQCRNTYCSECLIFAFGPKKPPYCVTCALNAAGVRHQGAEMNPRIRKKGFFGRKVLVDAEPRKELGFDDIEIELPEEAMTASAQMRVTRREVDPEVLAMVEAAEAAAETDDRFEPAGSDAFAAAPESESLGAWAASLDGNASGGDRHASVGSGRDARDASDAVTPWPDASSGTSF